MFQHQPPPKLILWFELVMTSREYARQVMEIKPEWLLEGEPARREFCECVRQSLTRFLACAVAPHYFKPVDLESLGGTKKGQVNAKAQGAAQLAKPSQI